MSQFKRPLRLLPAAALMSGTLFLAACESDEDRAERYFQSGIALLEEGDTERALLELRNVFNHDGFHFEARKLYADTLLKKGDLQQAYSQYLRLIEQYPDTLDVRLELARVAVERGDWVEAERHGLAAIELDPENIDARALSITLAFRDATLARNVTERTRLAEEANTLLEENRTAGLPDNAGLVRIVIDDLANQNNPEAALAAINSALESDPDAMDLNMGKIQILAILGDIDGTGDQLKRMTKLFPENTDIRQSMIRWYMTQQDTAGAEAFLRDVAGDDTGPTDNHMTVIQFLQATQGGDAARAELDRLVAANANTENNSFYISMLAANDFAVGNTDTAISTLRTALETIEEGEQEIQLKVLLAEMLNNTGQIEEARTIVTDVLEADNSNVEALKMSASWLIEEDKPGEAILALRTALNQNPRDPQTLTLMAMAHERDGDIDLVGERLSLAVEVSEQAASESVRYARFLMVQGRNVVAVNVLEDARDANPRNEEVLAMLGEVYLRTSDWSKAGEVAQAIRALDTAETRQRATELDFRILQAQNRNDESLKIIQNMTSLDDGDAEAQETRVAILTIQTQLRSGKPDAARAYLDQAMTDAPENPNLRLLDAGLKAIGGDLEEAEATYRGLIDEFPQSDVPVRLLAAVLMSTDRHDEARVLLDDAITRIPQSTDLLWLQASLMEREGDMDGAIGVYEVLYERNTRSTVIANNLASMLATHRDDEASIERAAAISRRLRGTNVPPFQDTYGWIAYRRGDLEEAVEYLEPAARSLGRDALVQYHLGMTYAGLGRTDDARTQLNIALELAEDSDLPQFVTARETLAALDAPEAVVTE